MEQVKVFHGTSIESLLDIKKNLFNTERKIWSVSEEDLLYVHCDMEQITMNNEELQDCFNELCNRAYESACISAIATSSEYKEVCILSITLDSEYLQKDTSCECIGGASMSDCCCINTQLLNELIRGGKAIVEYSSSPYCKSLGMFYISSLNQDILDLSSFDNEQYQSFQLIKNLDLSSIYDDLFDLFTLQEDLYFQLLDTERLNRYEK